MSDFKKICLIFQFKLQKCDACQNEIEFATNPLLVMSSAPPPLYRTHGSMVPSINKLFYGTVMSTKQLFMENLIVRFRQGTNYLTGPLVLRSHQMTNYLTGQSHQGSNYLTGLSRQGSNYLTGLSRQIAFPILLGYWISSKKNHTGSHGVIQLLCEHRDFWSLLSFDLLLSPPEFSPTNNKTSWS